MRIKQIKANVTEITFENGSQVMFSYETPVAARGADGTAFKSERFYSVTTSKHIGQWLRSFGSHSDLAEAMPRDFFNAMSAGVAVSNDNARGGY